MQKYMRRYMATTDNKYLEDLFGSTPETRMLDFFIKSDSTTVYNVLEIAREIEISVQRATHATEKLVSKGMLHVIKEATKEKRHIRYIKYRLNYDSPIVKSIVSLNNTLQLNINEKQVK